jgi:DNA polymerase III subunit epsilon
VKGTIINEPDYQMLNRRTRNNILSSGQAFFEKQIKHLFNKKQDSYYSGTASDLGTSIHSCEILDILVELELAVNWEQNINNASFVVFDTETTGLHPYKGDEIISVGAVIIENGVILGETVYYQMVNPKRPISKESKIITGITDEMLSDKPSIESVLLDLLKITGTRILVAHNAFFDLAFINYKLSKITGKRIVNPVIDTALLAAALFNFLGDCSLENTASYFGVNLEGRHHALMDALITANIFLKLLSQLESKNILTLPQLSQLFASNDLRRGYPLIF